MLVVPLFCFTLMRAAGAGGCQPHRRIARSRSARQLWVPACRRQAANLRILGLPAAGGVRLLTLFFSRLSGVSKTTQPAILAIQPSISPVPHIIFYQSL